MAILGLLIVTSLLWIFIHVIARVYGQHHDARTSNPLLPLSSRNKRADFDGILYLRRGTLHLGPLWLKYETSIFNSFFSRLFLAIGVSGLTLTGKRSRTTVYTLFNRTMKAFYTIGAAICIASLFLGWVMLLVHAAGMVWASLGWFNPADEKTLSVEDSITGMHLVKDSMRRLLRRQEGVNVPKPGVVGDEPKLHTLIPGVTVPLSDLPLLLLALASAGIIHELGHAITASLFSLPILSTGFHIHLVLPTFFVSIPLDDNLAASSKLRIAAAGAWHNIVTYIILSLLGLSVVDLAILSPLGTDGSIDGPTAGDICRPDTCMPSSASDDLQSSTLWNLLGYTSTAERGLVVTKVDAESPLYGYVQPGSVMMAVDDVRLGMADEGETRSGVQRWRLYLSLRAEEYRTLIAKQDGWCIPENWFNGQSSDCCSNGPAGSDTSSRTTNTTIHGVHGSQSCFISTKRVTKEKFSDNFIHSERCLDPVSLFTHQHIIMQGGTPSNPFPPNSSSRRISIEGSAFGSRCQTSCLVSDRDSEHYLCVRPRVSPGVGEDTRVLRLEIDDTSNGGSMSSRILVYRGPPSEILDHIGVGYILPPSFLPISFSTAFFNLLSYTIPAWASLFWDYFARLNLSLAAFNLLPIQGLDGGVICSVLVHWVLSKKGSLRRRKKHDTELQTIGKEDGERVDSLLHDDGESRREWNTDKFERGISLCTILLGTVVGLGTIWRDLV